MYKTAPAHALFTPRTGSGASGGKIFGAGFIFLFDLAKRRAKSSLKVAKLIWLFPSPSITVPATLPPWHAKQLIERLFLLSRVNCWGISPFVRSGLS